MDFWERWRVFPAQERFDVQTELIPGATWRTPIIASRVKRRARIEALEAHAALLAALAVPHPTPHPLGGTPSRACCLGLFSCLGCLGFLGFLFGCLCIFVCRTARAVEFEGAGVGISEA